MSLPDSLLTVLTLALATLGAALSYVRTLLWSVEQPQPIRVVLPYVVYVLMSIWIVFLVVTVLRQDIFRLSEVDGPLADVGRAIVLLVVLAPLSYLISRRRDLERAGFSFTRR
jgi:cell division protein FtsW (lipid II flippase)